MEVKKRSKCRPSGHRIRWAGSASAIAGPGSTECHLATTKQQNTSAPSISCTSTKDSNCALTAAILQAAVRHQIVQEQHRAHRHLGRQRHKQAHRHDSARGLTAGVPMRYLAGDHVGLHFDAELLLHHRRGQIHIPRDRPHHNEVSLAADSLQNRYTAESRPPKEAGSHQVPPAQHVCEAVNPLRCPPRAIWAIGT